MASDVMTKPHQLVASDRVEGTAVRRPNGDMIGHIAADDRQGHR